MQKETKNGSQTTGNSNWWLYKARQRQKQKNAEETKKKDQRHLKSKERTKTVQVIPPPEKEGPAFHSRMTKKQALDLAKKSLPASPRKKGSRGIRTGRAPYDEKVFGAERAGEVTGRPG